MTTSIEATLFTVELTHDVTTTEVLGEESNEVTRNVTELVQTFCADADRAIQLAMEVFTDGTVVGVHNNGHQTLLVDTGLLS